MKIKGMSKDMTCNGKQYKQGEVYEADGEKGKAGEGMRAKPTMTDDEAMRKIKALLAHDRYAVIMSERKRINKETVPRYNALFAGLKLKYAETGETVVITEFGELFETIRAKFPNGEVLWCLPEEFVLIEQEAYPYFEKLVRAEAALKEQSDERDL